MNTKNLVLMALLVGVGAVLYIIIPGINGGMKPDFMLTMMFIGILLFPNVKAHSYLVFQQVLFLDCFLLFQEDLFQISLIKQ